MRLIKGTFPMTMVSVVSELLGTVVGIAIVAVVVLVTGNIAGESLTQSHVITQASLLIGIIQSLSLVC